MMLEAPGAGSNETSLAETLGAFLRRARTAARLSLADLGSLLGYSQSFLSDVERDQRPVSRQLCDALSEKLGLDRVELYARAGHLTEPVAEYLQRRPRALAVLELLAGMDASDESLAAIAAQLAREEGSRQQAVGSDPELAACSLQPDASLAFLPPRLP